MDKKKTVRPRPYVGRVFAKERLFMKESTPKPRVRSAEGYIPPITEDEDYSGGWSLYDDVDVRLRKKKAADYSGGWSLYDDVDVRLRKKKAAAIYERAFMADMAKKVDESIMGDAASGDWTIFEDTDAEIDEGKLRTHMQVMKKPRARKCTFTPDIDIREFEDGFI